MNFKQIFIILLTFYSINCQSQTNKIEDRTINYYFEKIVKLELAEMVKQKVLIDSVTISPKYIDSTSKRLNKEGYMKYAEIKSNIYRTFFKDFLYQQKVEYNNNYYVLYFTMAGFDDMQWDIIKMSKSDWNGKERLSREKVKDNNTIEHLLFNYDEGEKNLENIRIFIKNNYLIMERGNLYHSLYDLNKQKVLINEESPWHQLEEGEELNKWIKDNLHDKIEKIINE